MSLWPSVLWSAARAAVVVALALPAGALVARRLRADGAGAWWAAALLPLVTPELLTGYGWGNFSLSLAARPWANELLTAALVWGRCACAAGALLAVAPPPSRTATAVFSRRLLLGRPPKPRSRRTSALGAYGKEAALRALGRFGATGGLVALLAFGAFEVPSLAGTAAWTVSLFDAHASLERLADSLRLAWPAAAAQTAGLVPVLAWLTATRGPRVRDERAVPPGRAARVAAGVALAVAVLLTVLVPAGVLAGRAGTGAWAELAAGGWRVRAFAGELGLALACGAAAAALAAAVLGAARRAPGAGGAVLAGLLVLPGLCGSLVVALAAQAGLTAAAAAGVPGAAGVRETVLPFVLALAVSLLPGAAVLGAFAEGRTPAVHLAGLLRRGTAGQRRGAVRVWWGLVGRGRLVRWGLLAVWGSGEVAAAAVLLPAGTDTAPPGLYNLMHYGHTGVLAALCLLSAAAPAALLALAAWAGPRLGRFRR